MHRPPAASGGPSLVDECRCLGAGGHLRLHLAPSVLVPTDHTSVNRIRHIAMRRLTPSTVRDDEKLFCMNNLETVGRD